MCRSFASKLGGQFATESHGQFLRNIHTRGLIQKFNEKKYTKEQQITELKRGDPLFPDYLISDIINFKGFTPLIFVPGWTKKDKSVIYQFDPLKSSDQCFESGGRSEMNIKLTYLTVIVAYEKIMSTMIKLSGEVYEFFRHIRNACAHNGKFHFDQKVIDKNTNQLLKPAKWKSFEIKASFQNVNLILKDKLDVTSYLDQGDIIEFLLDFENHYPQIKEGKA